MSGVSMILRIQIGVLLLDNAGDMDRCLVFKQGFPQKYIIVPSRVSEVAIISLSLQLSAKSPRTWERKF